MVALKSPSDRAAIDADTNIASLPAPSLGAWKSISPKILPSATSVSDDCIVSTVVFAPVFLRIRPSLCTCVNATSEFAPKESIASSDINRKSSPIVASSATPRPPAIVNAPSLADVFAVVAVIATTPPDEMVIALGSPAEPISVPLAIVIPKV